MNPRIAPLDRHPHIEDLEGRALTIVATTPLHKQPATWCYRVVLAHREVERKEDGQWVVAKQVHSGGLEEDYRVDQIEGFVTFGQAYRCWVHSMLTGALHHAQGVVDDRAEAQIAYLGSVEAPADASEREMMPWCDDVCDDTEVSDFIPTHAISVRGGETTLVEVDDDDVVRTRQEYRIEVPIAHLRFRIDDDGVWWDWEKELAGTIFRLYDTPPPDEKSDGEGGAPGPEEWSRDEAQGDGYDQEGTL